MDSSDFGMSDVIIPIYEYSCQACGHSFETLVRGGESPACSSCESRDLERLFSLSAIQSESTHGLAMRAAKTRDRKQAKENEYTQRQYELHHDDH